MITLIQYSPAFGLPSASPFCTKVEALLSVSGLPYDIEIWDDPRKAPKQKLPVLRDGKDMVADSSFIRMHLERAHNVDFDAHLSPAERAAANAFTKLCEEHLYWVIVYSRWMEDDNWLVLRDAYFSQIPGLIRPFITRSIRGDCRAQLLGHGMGKHQRDEVYELGAQDLQALADFLGEKPFFMGEQHSAVDATVYSFVAGLAHCDLPNPAKDAALAHKNLVSYCDRMREHYFANKSQQHAA